MSEMEKDKNNSKKAFRILKEVTGKRSVRTDVINDMEGRALTESVDILKRWEGYCGKLYKNQDGDTDNNCLELVPRRYTNFNVQYVRTCLGRPPLLPTKSGRSRQVVSHNRSDTNHFLPMCTFLHTARQ